MKVELELYKHQKDFVYSEVRHTALIAGYGAGKSFAGVAKALLMKLKYVGIPVAYYLPTYGLIKDIAFPKFTELLTLWKIPFKLNRTEKDIHTPYGIIHLRSMDKPDTIVGYEVGYSLIDETDILPLLKMTEVFARILARNRRKLPGGHINKTDVVGTPEGFKWAYKFFVKESSSNRRIIKGKTSDNKTLPSSYIDALKEVYTEDQLLAYLDGEFVNLTSGTVYRAFNRDVCHTDREVKKGEAIHVGMDFNITKMHAVVHVFDGDNFSAVDEIANAYDTPDMISVLKERYGDHTIVVYPDAAGGARSTSGKSDHQLLRDAGFQLRTREKNPLVRDRVNAMNAALKSGKLTVNTNRCPVYTEALENQAYKNGEPDKSTGYDHINEAGGYFVYYNDKVKLIRASYSIKKN